MTYQDDIMIIGSLHVENITETTCFIMAAIYIELEINQDKTKYIAIGKRTRDAQDVIVSNSTLQAVTNFKYLGTNINNTNNIHNEIHITT